jgi:hypothetical protein
MNKKLGKTFSFGQHENKKQHVCLGLCEVAKYKGTRFLRRKKIRNGNNLL